MAKRERDSECKEERGRGIKKVLREERKDEIDRERENKERKIESAKKGREIEIKRKVLGDKRVSDRERSVNKKREGGREKEKREN